MIPPTNNTFSSLKQVKQICWRNWRNHVLCLVNVREYRRAIKKGQSRETGNIGYIRGREKETKTQLFFPSAS